MLITSTLLVVLLLLLAYILYQQSLLINLTINGEDYQIQHDSPNREQSLKTLVTLRTKLNQLVDHLTKQHPDDTDIKRLARRFQDTTFRESNPDGDPTTTSYTINKGDTMVLCLRTVDQRLVDLNTLTYVAIHELAHVFSVTLNHTPEFWRKMSFLEKEAINLNLYQRTDYQTQPARYCGIEISTNIPEVYHDKFQPTQSGGQYPTTSINPTTNPTSISPLNHLLRHSSVKLLTFY